MNQPSPREKAASADVISRDTTVWVVANPTAGRGMGLPVAEAIARAAGSAGYRVCFSVERVSGLALPCEAGDLGAMVVVGGDGTLREAIERLLSLVPSDVAVPAVLPVPMGTANLVGQYLGRPRTLLEIGVESARSMASEGLRAGLDRMDSSSWPQRLNPWRRRLGKAGRAVADVLDQPLLERAEHVAEDVVATLRHGRLRPLDVGLANGRVFLLMAGVGIDAHVVHSLDARRRGPIGLWSYAMPALSAMTHYDFPAIEVFADGIRRFGPERALVMVANLPPYGTGFAIIPSAQGDDGLLDVVCLPCSSRAEFAKIFSLAAVGQHLEVPGPGQFRGRVIEVRSAEPVPVQVDGDPAAHLPLRCELHPRQIRLLSSGSWEQGVRNKDFAA